MSMVKKNTEQLILDFEDRFEPETLGITIEKRSIDVELNQYVLWFIVTSGIFNPESGNIEKITGESYTLDKALSELIKQAMRTKKPKMYPRRIHLETHPYDGMDNIVEYRDK